MTNAQEQAWGAVYRFTAMTNARLDGALRAESGMSLAEHELLATLDAHGGTARMGELARAMMFSKSGTTRLVAKLEEQNGWVARTLRPSDRRATWAELTPLGRKALATSRPVYRAAVAAVFGGHLPDTGLTRMAGDLEHVIAANGWSADPGTCPDSFAAPGS
ncbi:MarR family transcriptional regulator [Actinokineospora sp. PR83]|uniref:MarR family winged helix-turn-helix transcriptional regulator n=1 Tax=Actinokineospora sp. PR83 TaxID=2884908 RepID=UPI001F3633DF|nr:MarR family transcriptional regulator [Actinokineospora sp. PR83]MCG8917257.1 MarR family transcriptional regulator [Actinokineospora sp. PR83]